MTDRITRILALAEAATPAPWLRGIKEDPDAAREFVLAAFDKGAGTTHMVITHDGEHAIEDRCLVVALTGNGPTSEANADYLCAAGTETPWLATTLQEALRLLERVEGYTRGEFRDDVEEFLARVRSEVTP